MNKEQLIALGLTEEQANGVITGFGTMIPKSRFDDVNDAKKQLELDLASRDDQLEALKKIDAEGLQAEITRLQTENTDAKNKYENEIKETRLSSAIKLALHSKVQDTDIVTSLLDKTKVELNEDGTIKGGLDEQLKSLQEAKPFLFVLEKKEQTFKGWNPAAGNADKDNELDIGSNFAKEANSKGAPAEKALNPWGQ
ncbi:phage scaffolding protein [Bacillus sp. FJAT-22090]|uniref:phage scaffolding protein n=1 Tax=Bacillus sp. FJAT-22090 TaxID=1581038 RepID=UPI00119EBC8D|nr:phage scaffolding protein [Bacillus sp. FJAT-22090]